MRIFTVSTWSIIVISAILAIHLLGLWSLALFAVLHPTWTRKLDAWALIRLGAALTRDRDIDLPLLANVDEQEANILDQLDGWVGEHAVEESSNQQAAQGLSAAGPKADFARRHQGPPRHIVIGGSQLLHPDTMYAMFRSETVTHGLEKGFSFPSFKKGYQKLFSRDQTTS